MARIRHSTLMCLRPAFVRTHTLSLGLHQFNILVAAKMLFTKYNNNDSASLERAGPCTS